MDNFYRITALLFIIVSVLLTTFFNLGESHGIFGENSADMLSFVITMWVLTVVVNFIAIAEYIRTNRN